MGRFINADVFASTGQGFVGCNMFAYCNNNPVNGCDLSGMRMWYLDGNGNSVETNNDNRIDYFIYYYHPDSTSNFTEIVRSQSYSSRRFCYKAVGQIDDFVDAFNNISGPIHNVYIYVHGSFFALEFFHESMSREVIIDRINNISISGSIYLFACHGASVADCLSCASGEKVYASFHGVSFENGRARNSWRDVLLSAFLQCDLNGWFVHYPDGKEGRYTPFFFIY